MNRWLPVVSAACAMGWPFASVAAASAEEAKEQVLRVDQEWANAEIQRDAGALGRILDGHFIAVYGSGKVVDKETFIKDVIGDGTDRMRSQDMSDVTVRVRGDTAVVVETDTIRGTDHGQPYIEATRLTATYVKRNGNWVALAERFGRAADLKSEEAAIRQADAEWVEAAKSKKVDAWLAFYTDDAVVLPPNEEVAKGRESARKSVAELLALPGLEIGWKPTKVIVARSGDIAYLIGAYSLTFHDAGGQPLTDHGKLLEIWERQSDGTWRCSADTWNSDLPPAPQSR